jgi:hypothetical protein
MAKQSGLGAGLYVAGFEISNDIRDGSMGGGPALLDKTGIDKSAIERIGGVKQGQMSFTAHFNPTADRAHEVLSVLPLTDRVVTYRHSSVIGGDAASLQAKQINYDPTRTADGDLTGAVQYLSNGSPLEWGNLLTAGTRTDAAATNGTGWDGAASTAFGAQFYMHCTAFTGTSVTIKIQDSADNVSFADLTGGAFTVVSAAPAHQWIATGRTATVRRYLRVATTGTFSNAAFVVVGVKNTVAVAL